MVDLSFSYVRQKNFSLIIAGLGVWVVITYFIVDLKYFRTLGWIPFTLTFRACALDSPFLLDRVSSLIVNCLPSCTYASIAGTIYA